jgi:hypothetical protein
MTTQGAKNVRSSVLPLKNKKGFLYPLSSMKRNRKPWYLVIPGAEGVTVLTEQGEIATANPGKEAEILIAKQDGIGFTPNHKSLMAGTRPDCWTFKQRRQRVIEGRHDGGAKLNILPAGIFPEYWDTEDKCISFMEYLKWLAEQNVYVTARAGWSTLGRHLFLVSLSSPVRFFGITAANRAVLYGGRKSAPFPAMYKNAAKYDISGAYANALGTAVLPRMLTPLRNPLGSLVGSGEGVAYAIVDVPKDLRYPPLPVRPDRHSVSILTWPTGVISGWYTFTELRFAKELGCKVSPVVAYEGRLYHEDFSTWYGFIQEGRALRYGSRLAKHHANVLWSSFAGGPGRTIWKRYTADRLPFVVKEQAPGPDFNRATIYVSAFVSASVRLRLHREALLYPNGDERRTVVHCDTDGFIGSANESLSFGIALGDWRRVESIPLIQIKSANAYRYTCTRCGVDHAQWHYSVSGASSLQAKERAFRHAPRTMTPHDLASMVV